jgi:hypothetical protein
MIDDRSCATVSFEVVGTGGEIGAVKQHPNQTITLKFVGQLARRLEELVAVVDSRGFDDTANGENDGCLSEIVFGYVKSSTISSRIY